MRFKVWTEENGQKDIFEYDAKETKDGVWYAELDLVDFSDNGEFVANAYAIIGENEFGVASERFELLPEPIVVPEGFGTAVTKGERVYVKEVPRLLQKPELPTGCESVSLTIVLKAMGYDLEKTEIADKYLPRGTDLATTYVGDPHSVSGAGCFPPAIVKTANDYLRENKDTRTAHNITGTSMDDLCIYLDNGSPVILWTTCDMRYPAHMGSVSTFRGRAYEWYSGEHCVVLYGYDKEKEVYLISDPLEGLVERDEKEFKDIYDEIGRYAVVIY